MDKNALFNYLNKDKNNAVSWLKLGVAVAIIKSKPKEISAKQHTEKLCVEFSKSQINLKEKYNKTALQLKLLQKSMRKLDKTADHQVNDLDQTNLTPPPSFPSLVHGLPTLPLWDGVHQMQGSKTLKGPLTPYENSSNLQQKTDQDQQLFTKGVQELSTILSGRVETQAEMFYLLDVCTRSLHNMAAVVVQPHMTISGLCLCEGARVVVDLLQKYPRLEEQDAVMQGLCALVENILAQLRRDTGGGGPSSTALDIGGLDAYGLNHRRQQHLSDMTIVFLSSMSFPLLPSMLESIVEGLDGYCKTLMVQSNSNPVTLDPDVYENGYFMLRCLEVAFTKWSQASAMLKESLVVSVEMLKLLQSGLDGMASPLVHRFPLVVRTLWRITSLVEHILQSILCEQ